MPADDPDGLARPRPGDRLAPLPGRPRVTAHNASGPSSPDARLIAEYVAPGGWVWCGYAGHFVASKNCRFHMHTRVGNYRISTVGDYHPGDSEEPQPIGAGPDSLYETYVFVVEGYGLHGEGEVAEWCEVDGERYGTAEEAEKGHMRYCYEYDGKPAPVHSDGLACGSEAHTSPDKPG